jgi:hypothetical protein
MCKNQLFAEVSSSLQYLSASQTALPGKLGKPQGLPSQPGAPALRLEVSGHCHTALPRACTKIMASLRKNGISWDQMGFKYMGLIWNLCRIFLLWRSSEGHIRKDWSLMCKNYHLNIYICVCMYIHTYIYMICKTKAQKQTSPSHLAGFLQCLWKIAPKRGLPFTNVATKLVALQMIHGVSAVQRFV